MSLAPAFRKEVALTWEIVEFVLQRLDSTKLQAAFQVGSRELES